MRDSITPLCIQLIHNTQQLGICFRDKHLVVTDTLFLIAVFEGCLMCTLCRCIGNGNSLCCLSNNMIVIM